MLVRLDYKRMCTSGEVQEIVKLDPVMPFTKELWMTGVDAWLMVGSEPAVSFANGVSQM